MPKTIQKRNPVQMGHNTYHKAIYEHGIRKRYSEFKIAVLQVLNAPKQKPSKSTPFVLGGPDVYWVPTTLQLHEGGAIPFTELPGLHPRTYTFDKLWEIPKREEGAQLRLRRADKPQKGLQEISSKTGNCTR